MKAQDLKAVLINNLKNVYYWQVSGDRTGLFWWQKSAWSSSLIRAIPFMPMRLVSPLWRLLKPAMNWKKHQKIIKDAAIQELGFEDEITVAYQTRLERLSQESL